MGFHAYRSDHERARREEDASIEARELLHDVDTWRSHPARQLAAMLRRHPALAAASFLLCIFVPWLAWEIRYINGIPEPSWLGHILHG